MKKWFYLSLLLLALSSATGLAQSRRYIHCEVLPVGVLFSPECTLSVRFADTPGTKNSYIVDEAGVRLRFNNKMAALDWLSKLGWELCGVQTKVSDGDSNGMKWIMRYCVEGLSEEEIQEIPQMFYLER